jgi:hypothetical protein
LEKKKQQEFGFSAFLELETAFFIFFFPPFLVLALVLVFGVAVLLFWFVDVFMISMEKMGETVAEFRLAHSSFSFSVGKINSEMHFGMKFSFCIWKGILLYWQLGETSETVM